MSSSRRLSALCLALSFGAAPVHAQTATPAAVPSKPECSVSDVPATGSATATAPPIAPAANPKKSAAPVLAENVRRDIFIELQQIVARAQREAGVAYPISERAPLLSPTDVDKPNKLSGKREAMAISLERVYLADLLTRRSLACAAARDIWREGRDAHWPTAKPRGN